MAKYNDRRSAGRSRKVPYQVGETAADRHWRRFREALKGAGAFNLWCNEQALVCKITNEGQHWQAKKDGHVADWWPSSAKLVFDRNYQQGIHCHDMEQLKQEIVERWSL